MAQFTIELTDSQAEILKQSVSQEGLSVEEFLTDTAWQRIKNEKYYQNKKLEAVCSPSIDIEALNATVKAMSVFLGMQNKGISIDSVAEKSSSKEPYPLH